MNENKYILPAADDSVFGRFSNWLGLFVRAEKSTGPSVENPEEPKDRVSEDVISGSPTVQVSVPEVSEGRPVLLTAKLPDLKTQIAKLAALIDRPEPGKPVLVIYADAHEGKHDPLRLAKRVAKTAGSQALVYYCDVDASRKLAACAGREQVVSPGAAKLFYAASAKSVKETVISHADLSKASKIATDLLKVLQSGVGSFLERQDDRLAVSGNEGDVTESCIRSDVPMRAQFSEESQCCEIFVTPEVKRILENTGRPKGLPVHVHKTLIAKLNNPEGKFEPKGRRFWGIDITSNGPNAYRSIFTLSDQNQVVLCFLGGHEEYKEFSIEMTSDVDAVWRHYTAPGATEKLQMPLVAVSQKNLVKAMTGRESVPDRQLQRLEV